MPIAVVPTERFKEIPEFHQQIAARLFQPDFENLEDVLTYDTFNGFKIDNYFKVDELKVAPRKIPYTISDVSLSAWWSEEAEPQSYRKEVPALMAFHRSTIAGLYSSRISYLEKVPELRWSPFMARTVLEDPKRLDRKF